MKIQIVTTEPLIKDFKGSLRYVIREIKPIEDDLGFETRSYAVRSGLFKKDKDGNFVFVESRQEWTRKDYSYEEIDNISLKITANVKSGLTKTKREVAELQQALLYLTQEEEAWGIPKGKWEILK